MRTLGIGLLVCLCLVGCGTTAQDRAAVHGSSALLGIASGLLGVASGNPFAVFDFVGAGIDTGLAGAAASEFSGPQTPETNR